MRTQKLSRAELEQEIEELFGRLDREFWKVTVIGCELMIIVVLLTIILGWERSTGQLFGLFALFGPMLWWLTGFIDELEDLGLELYMLEYRQRSGPPPTD
jgi:hypothetical protein